MSEFGVVLRRLREAERLRQVDLADRLGVARSTIAGIERGHDFPTPRLWVPIQTHFPRWVGELGGPYEQARRGRAGRRSTADLPPVVAETETDAAPESGIAGPYVIESLGLVYVFRDSRVPEEIIEVRRVRATRAASGYGVVLGRTNRSSFQVETEALWGGVLDPGIHRDAIPALARVEFGRTLRRGMQHEFALRHWVIRAPDRDTSVDFAVTLPTKLATVHLHFLGPTRPARAWTFGPLDPADTRPLLPTPTLDLRVTAPVPGATYGIGWSWE